MEISAQEVSVAVEDKQWEETVARVRQHLPEFNPFHTSLPETVVMLLDELDRAKSGKPTWMDKE